MMSANRVYSYPSFLSKASSMPCIWSKVYTSPASPCTSAQSCLAREIILLTIREVGYLLSMLPLIQSSHELLYGSATLANTAKFGPLTPASLSSGSFRKMSCHSSREIGFFELSPQDSARVI